MYCRLFVPQKLKRSCDNDSALLRDNLSFVGWDFGMWVEHSKLCSTHIPNLKVSTIPRNEEMKGNATCKILVLSHSLGDLGVTHRVHLWLDGKCIVDFLLAIIKRFWLTVTAAALLSEICRNRRFLKGWVTLSPNFR